MDPAQLRRVIAILQAGAAQVAAGAPRNAAYEAAVLELHRAYTRQLLRELRRRGVAWDLWAPVVSAVWTKVVLVIPQYRGTGRFETWLHRVARNAATDFLRHDASRYRKERRLLERLQVAQTVGDDLRVDVEADLVDRLDGLAWSAAPDAVRAAVRDAGGAVALAEQLAADASLTLGERDYFACFVEGLSRDESAERLGISPEAARLCERRMLSKLRDAAGRRGLRSEF